MPCYGTMTDLGTLGGSYSSAAAINQRAQVVGWGWCATAPGEYHAFLWQNGTMTDLGTLRLYSSINAINERGQVVGVEWLGKGRGRPFLLQGGTITYLDTLGGYYSAAVAINERGQVVGRSKTPTGENHAVLWWK